MAPGIGATKRTNHSELQRHRLALNRRRLSPISIIPQSGKQWPTIWGKAMQWLLPWPQEGYPGVKAGVVELLSGRASWAAFKHWRAGRHAGPEWFSSQLADMIEGRCRTGLAIVQELRNYRKPEVRLTGAMAVQADGRDRRGGRIGRRNPSRQGSASVEVPRSSDSGTSQPSDTPSDFD